MSTTRKRKATSWAKNSKKFRAWFRGEKLPDGFLQMKIPQGISLPPVVAVMASFSKSCNVPIDNIPEEVINSTFTNFDHEIAFRILEFSKMRYECVKENCDAVFESESWNGFLRKRSVQYELGKNGEPLWVACKSHLMCNRYGHEFCFPCQKYKSKSRIDFVPIKKRFRCHKRRHHKNFKPAPVKTRKVKSYYCPKCKDTASNRFYV